MVNVSVIIPVYNEICFIQKTLESVVGEADEIILSDNASTDGTSDICQSFANKYPEIKYTRHRENMGSLKNGLFAINQVSGKYIRHMGGHDMISIGSNWSMASLLDKNPDVVMVYPKYVIGLNKDYTVRFCSTGDKYKDDFLSDSAFVRVKRMIYNFVDVLSSVLHGLWRADVLLNVVNPRIFQSVCTDHALLSSTAAKGKMLVDERSVFFMMHPRDESLDMVQKRYENTHFSSSSVASNLYYWAFAILSEEYDMLLENFSDDDIFSNGLFDALVSALIRNYGYFTLTLDGLPPIIPGKESLCQNVMTLFNDAVKAKLLIDAKELKSTAGDLSGVLRRYSGRYILFGQRNAKRYIQMIETAGFGLPVAIWDNLVYGGEVCGVLVVKPPEGFNDKTAVIFTVNTEAVYRTILNGLPDSLQAHTYFFERGE